LLLFFFALQQTMAQSESSNDLYTAASDLYQDDNFDSAGVLFNRILESGEKAFEVYYNLGNVYYKQGKIGKCILNYERAKKIRPYNEDLLFNLDIANIRIKDKIKPAEEVFIVNWWNSLVVFNSANGWSFYAIISVWLAFAAAMLYLFTRRVSLRKVGFYLCILGLLFFLLTAFIAYARAKFDKTNVIAIITASSSVVKSAPNEKATNLYLIHEGLKVKVVDKVGAWKEIELPNGDVGWVLTQSIEEV
jgi:tetratricopeptide (TPR) repeat protein